MKQRIIHTSATLNEVEQAFKEEGIYDPIIVFRGYDDKTKEDCYIDEKSSTEVRISTAKEVIPCAICAKRDAMRKKLKREVEKYKNGSYVENWNREKGAFLRTHKECEGCGGIVGSSIADFDMTTHTHVCESCGLNYPKDSGIVYEGKFSDPSLERDEML